MKHEDSYDAVLIVSFGGPEGPEDVIPFLENVLRGRNVPRERLEEVAGHYLRFGGVSPLNEQNRRNVAAQLDFTFRRADEETLRTALTAAGETLSRFVTRLPESTMVTDAKVLAKVELFQADSLPSA